MYVILLHPLGQKSIGQIGMPEKKLESPLEEINVYCFGMGIHEKQSLSKT
jgi:hypothetical protein